MLIFERNCVFIVKRIEPIVGRVMLPHYTASSNKEATLYLVSADVRWRKMLPCFQSLVEIVIFQFESTNHQFCNILLWFLSNPAPSMQINNQIFAPALPHKCCILHWFCPLVACVSQNSPFLDCIIEGSSYWKKTIILYLRQILMNVHGINHVVALHTVYPYRQMSKPQGEKLRGCDPDWSMKAKARIIASWGF